MTTENTIDIIDLVRSEARAAAEADFVSEQNGSEWKTPRAWRGHVETQIKRELTDPEWRKFVITYQQAKGQLAAAKFPVTFG